MAEATFDMPYSVDVILPPHWAQRLEALVSAGEAYASIELIHAALWQMRGSEMTHEERRAELEAEIVAGLDSGPGVEVTPEFWAAWKRKCEARHAWITALMQQNVIGNTLLPEKLYRYIQDKMASGVFPQFPQHTRKHRLSPSPPPLDTQPGHRHGLATWGALRPWRAVMR